ncbi:MAG: hypothetical protein WBD47_08280 [Phormidesmis sp.]
MATRPRQAPNPYRKTCPNLPYPDDYEAETASPLSALSRWIDNLASIALR